MSFLDLELSLTQYELKQPYYEFNNKSVSSLYVLHAESTKSSIADI